MFVYRFIALALAVIFAAVGLVFLIAPSAVATLFDLVTPIGRHPAVPAADADSGLFRALAVAYMYVVALLAWMMFRQPGARAWPMLLAHAKLASAAVSLLLFMAHAPYLVYGANAIVDGLIGVGVLLLRRTAMVPQAATGRIDNERSALPS